MVFLYFYRYLSKKFCLYRFRLILEGGVGRGQIIYLGSVLLYYLEYMFVYLLDLFIMFCVVIRIFEEVCVYVKFFYFIFVMIKVRIYVNRKIFWLKISEN